jgi:excisionase family DNA binding protein
MENAIDCSGYIKRLLTVLGTEVPIGVCPMRAIDHIRGVAADLTDGAATFAATFAGGRRRRRHAVGMTVHEKAPYDGSRTRLLQVNDVAGQLAISRDSVYRLVRSGELPSFRVGERLRFRQTDVDSYVERNREPAP